MNRQVGPYSTLITPQAGSLFHAVLQHKGHDARTKAGTSHGAGRAADQTAARLAPPCAGAP
jgi:hypothetical protein